jgi:hypothetical protein
LEGELSRGGKRHGRSSKRTRRREAIHEALYPISSIRR